MKKSYTMIVKSITNTTIENDEGKKDTDKLSLKNKELDQAASITAEEGAFEGLMIGERVEISIFNPQKTLTEVIKADKKKK